MATETLPEAPATWTPASLRAPAAPACPGCGRALSEADLEGALLPGPEAEALRAGRWGAHACAACDAILPWEA